LKVSIQTAAHDDILRQYRYYLVEKDAARIAQQFLAAVQSAVETLSRTPEMGTPKHLENPLLAGLRSWPIPRFPSIRLYYIYAGNTLRIVRVLHGKRDIYPLLGEDDEV
jgi:toxin ParE1/3/4